MIPIGSQVKDVELFPIAARTTTVGTYRSAVVDRLGFSSAVQKLHSAASSAGTETSLAIKLQESDPLARGSKNHATGAADADHKLNQAANANTKLSIKVTQAGARQISKVVLKAKSLGAIAAGKIVTLRLETNNAGNPSGTLIHGDATVNVLCSTIGTSYQWVEFNFARPIDIANGTVFHAVLSADYDASATVCVIFASSTVASGGDFNTHNGTSWGTLDATKLFVGYIEQYNFSDVASQAFTAVTEAAGSFQAKDVDLRAGKRFLSLLATVTGTDASFVCGAHITLGGSDVVPVAG